MKYMQIIHSSRSCQHLITLLTPTEITSCARGDTICPRPSPPPEGTQAPRAPPSRRNEAVVSHAQ